MKTMNRLDTAVYPAGLYGTVRGWWYMRLWLVLTLTGSVITLVVTGKMIAYNDYQLGWRPCIATAAYLIALGTRWVWLRVAAALESDETADLHRVLRAVTAGAIFVASIAIMVTLGLVVGA